MNSIKKTKKNNDIKKPISTSEDMNSSVNSISSTKSYSESARKKIRIRIDGIKQAKHFKELFRIAHNNNAPYTINASGGVYLNLNIWNNASIALVEAYLDKHFPIVNLLPIDTKYKPYCSDSASNQDSSLKLTNQEKNFLRKIDSTDNNAFTESDTVTTTHSIVVKPFN